AARVFCPSRATLEDLVRICQVAPERIRIVPKGVDARMGPAAAAEAPGARPGSNSSHTILHVSSGWPYQNVAATIRVVAALRARDVDVTLVRSGVVLTRDERARAERLRVLPWNLDRGWVSAAVLVGPALAAELRARGLQRAAQYSWRRTVAAYAEIYREVIDAAQVRA